MSAAAKPSQPSRLDAQEYQPKIKTKEQIRLTVLSNVVKMMVARGLIKKASAEEVTKKLKKPTDSSTYHIKLDNATKDQPSDLYVLIVPQKIVAIKKSSPLNDFLSSYDKSIKMLIVDAIGTKAQQSIRTLYNHAEVFTEGKLMINLIDHVLLPKFEPLTEDEKETFYEDFKCKKRQIPKMLTADPVSRYYNLKPNDIVRIIRPSETSAFTVSYRIVVQGQVKKK